MCLVQTTLGTELKAPEMPVAKEAADVAVGAPSTVGNGVKDTTETVAGKVAGVLPPIPDAPLPAMAPPVSVPVVGSSAPHTANPTVCGILGGIIVLNWIIACCFAGVAGAGGTAAAAQAAQGEEGGAAAAGAAGGVTAALFACIECLASICSIIALLYAAFTGLFRAWLGGQAVSGWCLAMAIISTLQLLACVCICCCASCGSAILGETAYKLYVEDRSKLVMGNHMHELVHKHKPGGTHPITEGYLPYHEDIQNHIPLAKAGPAPKKAKEGVPTYGTADSAPASGSADSAPAGGSGGREPSS